MSNSIKTLLLLLLVVSAAVLLCLLVPALDLLELFLVLTGGLVLAAGVSKVNDVIHRHKIRQKLREVELERQKRQLPLAVHNQAGTPHQRMQGQSRRLRGGPCCP
jgi:hypothetical protein